MSRAAATPAGKLADHPVAQIFPMMNPADRAALGESIANHGLREDIVLLEGKILDGRNRYETCVERGVKPRFREYDFAKDGPSPTQYVLDKNLTRRHLTTSQLAAIGAEALPFFHAEAKARQAIAGGKNGASPAKVATGTASFIRGGGHTGSTPGKGKDEFSQETGHDPAEESQAPGRGAKSPATARKPAGGAATPDPAKKTAATGQRGTAKATSAKKPTAAKAPAATGPADPKPPAAAGPAPKKTPTAGKARDQAAATVGVSGSLVGQAAAIKKQAPKTFEKVKAGEMSVTAAKATLDASKKRQAEYDTALQRVAAVAGPSLAAAAKEGTRLKGKREVIAYAALSDDEMIAIRGLIADGWTVDKARKYKAHTLSRTHRISDLIARAAAAGGIFTLELAPFIITVQHKDTIDLASK